jgi:hypothetical protein
LNLGVGTAHFTNWEGHLTNKDVNKVPGSRLKVPASRKKKAAGRTAKLKSSSWYESAARSIRISTRRAPGKPDEFDR